MDVVVAAHNEESVITGCLDRLAESRAVRRVVVVANGCTDRTAELARTHPSAPEVLVVPEPGKAAALNLGDGRCETFPRAYLDADVELSGRGLDSLATAIGERDAHAAVPSVRMELTHSSWLVRRYYAVWQALPAVGASSAGRGVYVLSKAAHERVFPLPDGLISDDGYVSRRVPPHERVEATEAVVVVRAPRDARSLIRRRQRVQRGNAGLHRPRSMSPGTGVRTVAHLVRDGRAGAFDAVVFVAVTALARAAAKLRRGRANDWGFDASSRSSAPG